MSALLDAGWMFVWEQRLVCCRWRTVLCCQRSKAWWVLPVLWGQLWHRLETVLQQSQDSNLHHHTCNDVWWWGLLELPTGVAVTFVVLLSSTWLCNPSEYSVLSLQQAMHSREQLCSLSSLARRLSKSLMGITSRFQYHCVHWKLRMQGKCCHSLILTVAWQHSN